jgi:hypothetical protein
MPKGVLQSEPPEAWYVTECCEVRKEELIAVRTSQSIKFYCQHNKPLLHRKSYCIEPNCRETLIFRKNGSVPFRCKKCSKEVAEKQANAYKAEQRKKKEKELKTQYQTPNNIKCPDWDWLCGKFCIMEIKNVSFSCHRYPKI